MILIESIKRVVRGEVLSDDYTLSQFSKDASLFEMQPEVVVAPKDTEDIKKLVKWLSLEKRQNPRLSITARSAGTDMMGGPLSDSIVLDFLKHLNWLGPISDDGVISTAPGVYCRDFEKVTLTKNYFLPSYPASRELCAMGGIVNNNSGGEQTLGYGKTQKYVKELKMVLADGKEYAFKKLDRAELNEKMKQIDFEGGIYRAIFGILESNYNLVKGAKPLVSKNSAGYNVWDVWDRETETFDMTRLFIGAQGTLGIMTEVSFKLIKTKPYSGMAVVYLKNLAGLPALINETLKFKPNSMESFDDHTLKLSMKFLFSFVGLRGFKNLFTLILSFLPDLFHVIKTGLPKLILMIEFKEDSQEELAGRLKALSDRLGAMGHEWRIARSKSDEKKYWTIRRESFNLLRHRVVGKQTAPYIDDLIVRPEYLPEFLPKLYEILNKYKFLYTISGHVGDGNFHIIPLMDLKDPNEVAKIRPSMEEVYDLVLEYHGSISAEHNDGLLRGPYIKQMFGEDVFKIFKDIKKIFDPQNIFNPHKKTDSSLNFTFSHIKSK